MKRYIFVNAFFTLLFFVANTFAQTYGWGDNGAGYLGFPSTGNSNPVPQSVSALSDITAISGGEDATLFLRADGTIASSGSNSMGALGIGGNVYPYPVPSTVMNMTGVAQVSGGRHTSLALKADGTVWAWGLSVYGQIGNGTIYGPNGEQWFYTPQQTSISDVVQLSSGFLHSVALKSDGTVWSWGRFDYGTQNSSLPVRVGETVSGFENIIAVSAGEYADAAVKSDGTVWIWGSGQFGLNGSGIDFPPETPTGTRLPRQIPNLDNIVQVAVGQMHIAALKRDGTVWVWGNNYEGECGRGSMRDFLNSAGSIRTRRGEYVYALPNHVISDVIEIKSGGWHILARKRDGSVWAWGANWHGQIGDGTSMYNSMFRATPLPKQALVGTGNAMIGASWRASFAVKPVIQTPSGFGVKHYGENVQILFANVMNLGVTSYTALDAATVGSNIPAGYTVQVNQPAYSVATTAQTSGDIDVCLKVNEYDGAEFLLLKLLHEEGGNWVDRTLSYNAMRQQLCARVTSLSSFVVAKVGGGFGKN